jgi:hypothetical protein
MAFVDPYDRNPPRQSAGASSFVDPYDNGDVDEGEGLQKGSLKDQVHDIASGGTAALDLVTMLPGMVGGAIGTGAGILAHGSKQPAQDLLQGIGEGGERSSASNLLGINESDPSYRERPGYKAVMKPVEALTQGMHLAGQGVEKAASAGWLGTDRTNPAVAKELGAGTELGLLAALPFLRGPGAKPGSQRAYRETTERPKQGDRARDEARDTYPAEEPTKPFDMRDFKEPVMEEFAPEFRPSQFEGPEEAIMTPAKRGFRDTRGIEDPFIKSEPKLTEQDYFGTTEQFRNTKEVRPTRDFDDIPHQIDKRGYTVSPQHEAPRGTSLPSVMREAETATDPLTFRSYDPNRISDQVSASEKPGFLRSAEEVMRARELERAEMPRDRSTPPAERRHSPVPVETELRKAPFDYTKIDAEVNKHLEAFLNGKNGARGKLDPKAMGDVGPGKNQRGGPGKSKVMEEFDAKYGHTRHPYNVVEKLKADIRREEKFIQEELQNVERVRAKGKEDVAKSLEDNVAYSRSQIEKWKAELPLAEEALREIDHKPASPDLGDKGPGKKQRGGPLWEIKRKGPVKALQEEAREMSLEGRHNTPIEKVVERVAAGKVEDFTAERSNQFWNAVARMGSLVKENLLIDTSIRQIMKDKKGSGPLIKWAVDSVSHIEREAVKMTKAAVNEGLTDLRRMYNSKHLRSQGMEMIKKWQENVGVRDLTREDFTTERQWQTYSKIRAQDDLLLERVNAIRAQSKDAEGKPLEPIARIPSHFRGMWEGDYRVFAYDSAGNKKFAQGFDTEWSAKKVAAEMQKKHPELTVKSDHVKTDQYGIPNLSGFEDAIRIMSEKNDPVAKALQATYHQILQRRGFGRTGVHRKGVAGGLGSEGGLLGFRNTERALEEHFNQGYRYIANLEKQKVLADLQSVPKEMWDKMPQTKEFLESYVRKTQGKKLRDDGWIDSALIGLSRAIGMGEHGPLKAVRGISTVATLWWLTTPRFLMSQSVQSLNAIPKLVQRFGHVDAAGSYFTGLNRALFEGARDASSKEAIKWAAERGYLDATIHNLMEKGWSGRPIGSMAESIKEVMSWPAMGIERKLVRTPTFLAFEHALRDKIKDKVQRFEEAAEAADYYMVNYGGSHTPMAYNKMGLTGDAVKPLKQYAHNTWGQFFEYARNAKNKGEVAPLAWFMGIQASVAGLKGMMIVAEVTAVISLLNYMFDLDIPTPEQLMLKGGLHEALVFGGLSTALQHDVSASVSAPGIPNMFSAPPIQFTTRLVGDLGNYAWKKANGEDTDQDRLRALLAISPNAMHEWIKGMYQEEGQPTPNPYDANLRGNYRRTEAEDWMAKIIGAKPLNEAKADAIMRAVKQDLQRDMRQKNNAGEAIVDRIMNGQDIPEKLMQKYIEQGGNVAGLPKFIMNKIKERNMTGAERQRDIRSITPNNAHKLDTLNDYLNEIDDRLREGGGYRFDPETGEIVPISMQDMGDGNQNNHNVNDSEPPSRRHFPKGQETDKRMKMGSKERSGSEYRTPQLNPEKFYERQLSRKKYPLENAVKDRIRM